LNNIVRVLHVYRTYFPDTQGGLEEVIRQICLNTQTLSVDSRVLTTSSNPASAPIDLNECTVYQNRKHIEIASCSIALGAVPEFKRQLAWADIVHYHFPWPFADILHFAVNVNKPTVVTYHSDIVRQRLLGWAYRPLMNRFLSSVDSIICTSPNYFATSDVLSRHAHKVNIIPIGINDLPARHIQKEEVDIEIEAQYGRDFFLFVGVMRYYKGLHILLQAAHNASYRFVLVGSGPIEQDLKEQAKKMGLNNVTFAGYLPDRVKNHLFNLAIAVVFPSYLRAEAFGITLLEGARHGRPLISTEIGSGTSHVNIHGETGLVVPPGSHTALRRALDQIWHNRETAKHMGNQARKRYEKLFSGKVMGERYFALYQSMLTPARDAQNSSNDADLVKEH